MNDLDINNSTFEKIKHFDEKGNEFWYGRELGKILQYSEYRKFVPVIKKSMIACANSDYRVSDHFVQMDVMVDIGSNAKRKLKDYKLSRYACYLIVQNSDSTKEVVSLGQTYFAVQTRRQELSEQDYNLLSEDEKRLYRRNQTKSGNYSLNKVASKAGVKNFDKFHNYGYKGLYNGETANDIAKRKELRYREDILDNMGSEELSANLFRIDQTEAKIKRDNVICENEANKVHYDIGKEIRNFIKKLGGTMPEDLPTPNKSLKEIEKHDNKQIK